MGLLSVAFIEDPKKEGDLKENSANCDPEIRHLRLAYKNIQEKEVQHLRSEAGISLLKGKFDGPGFRAISREKEDTGF